MITVDEVVKKYLGTPYKYKGRDPNTGLDCWGLGVCVFKDLGITLADFDIDYRENWGDKKGENYFLENYWQEWDLVETGPRPFDCVLFKSHPDAMPNHGGVYLGDDKFLHACKAGVVIGDMRREVLQRLRVGFFRHKGLK